MDAGGACVTTSGDWRLAVACAGEMRLIMNSRGSKKWRRAKAQHRSPVADWSARWRDGLMSMGPSHHHLIAGSHRIESLVLRTGEGGEGSGWRQLWISQIAPDGILPSRAFRVAVIRCESVRPRWPCGHGVGCSARTAGDGVLVATWRACTEASGLRALAGRGDGETGRRGTEGDLADKERRCRGVSGWLSVERLEGDGGPAGCVGRSR